MPLRCLSSHAGDRQRETALSQAIHGQGRVALVSGGSRGIGAAIELRRFGSAAEVADLVASLLCAGAPDITGRVLEMTSAIAL
jgi:hypothetical protein